MLPPRHSKRVGRLCLSTAIAAMAVGAQQASAQTASPPAKKDDVGSASPEIVVTAQRRSESVQKVPISIQVLSSETLARQAVVDTRDIAMISPTVNYQSGNSATGSAFSLRGVSSSAIQAGIQPSTALVIDGVVAYTQAEFIANLSDIDHIEILNGPQGTLFGKNSTAGVISIVTRQPKNILEGSAEASITSDDEVVLRGMINLPIADKVRLRLNGFYQDQKPLIRNLTGSDVLGQRAYGISAKLAFDLSDTATFTLAGDYAHSYSSAGQFLPVGPGVFAALAQVPYGRGGTTIATNTRAEDFLTTKKITGTLAWKLSDTLSLTSISNFTRFREESNIDADTTPNGANAGVGNSIPGSAYPFQNFFQGYPRYPSNIGYYSEELRLNLNSGPLTAVFGGYYQHVDYKYALIQVFNFDGSVLGLTPGVRYDQSDQVHARVTDSTLSAFGDLTYALTNQLKLFGGLRYTHEQIGVDYHRDSYFGSGIYNQYTGKFTVPPATYDASSRHSLDNLSGRAGIQFEPSNATHFYASFAKGYKAPAADIGTSLIAGKDPIIKPEKATAYEIGAKLRPFGGRLALNGAVFWEKISGIQASILDVKSTTLNPQLLNAGQLKTRGFEGDASWAVTSGLGLTGALAYVKATYAGFAFACNSVQTASVTCPNFTGPGLQDITGQPAVGAPKWKYSIGANYEAGIRGGKLRYYGQLTYTWTDSIQYQLGNDPLTLERSHGMLNASIGLRSPGHGWEIQLFAKNLTNKFYYANLINFPLDGQPVGWIPRDFHRFLGLKITSRF